MTLRGVSRGPRRHSARPSNKLALEQLSSLIAEPHAGSPKAVLRVMQEPPHPTAADVAELDAAILAGRLTVRARDLFSTDPS